MSIGYDYIAGQIYHTIGWDWHFDDVWAESPSMCVWFVPGTVDPAE